MRAKACCRRRRFGFTCHLLMMLMFFIFSMIDTIEAQATGFYIPGPKEFGASICHLADLDGDGVSDFAVGAPGDNQWGANSGSVFVFSGANSSILFRLYPNKGALSKNGRFGFCVNDAGDVNSDGVHDILVGAEHLAANPSTTEGAGYIQVFSGKTGALIGESKCWDYAKDAPGGQRATACGVGDLNSDSYDDVLIAFGNWAAQVSSGKILTETLNQPPQGKPADYFVLYDYATRQQMRQSSYGESENRDFGYSVDAIGDINGDGASDFAVSTPNYSAPNTTNRGYIQVYSGSNGNRLYKVSGTQAGDDFGYSISKISDLNGDGISDILVGAPSWDSRAASYISALSGVNGGVLLNITGWLMPAHLGASLAPIKDLDGDGLEDIISAVFLKGPITFGFTFPSHTFLTCFSSKSGNVIFNQEVYPPGNSRVAISNIGDTNRDGKDEVAFGIPNQNMIRILSPTFSPPITVAPKIDLSYEYINRCPRCSPSGDCVPSSLRMTGGTARCKIKLSKATSKPLIVAVSVTNGGNYQVVKESSFDLTIAPGSDSQTFDVVTTYQQNWPYKSSNSRKFTIKVTTVHDSTTLNDSVTIDIYGVPWWCQL